jgi:lysozyme family protein
MNFDTAFDRLIGHEGAYVNNPKDPGGETKWGISKREYPQLNIKALTREDARLIYRKDFWSRIKADQLSDGVAYQTFDFAVNSGIGVAIRALQRAVDVADDGVWGPVSEKAAKRQSESDTIMRLCAERLEFMTRLSTWPTFGRGWARRIAMNLRYGAVDSD